LAGMAGDRTARISRLSQRFSTHAVGRKRASERTRERKSFYLDAELVTRMDQVFRELNHTLYPKQISKSTFLSELAEGEDIDDTEDTPEG
jgi:hypothetical protein